MLKLLRVRNVAVLFLAQILVFSVIASMVLVAPLVGATIAPTARLATLPLGLMVIGTAIAVAPVALSMRRFGRRAVFLTAAGVGCAACLLAAGALALESFFLFGLASMGIGLMAGAMMQFRFAAMESVQPDQIPSAASCIIFAGIVAAWLGPELAIAGRALAATPYLGSYLLLALLVALTLPVLAFYRNVTPAESSHAQAPRAFADILRSPTLWLAVVASAVGYGVMTGMMTSTSLGMHSHFGHSEAAAKQVIQSHITAMFLPSLVAPALIRRIGIRGLLVAGSTAYAIAFFAALQGTGIGNFQIALVALGIGWNFLFTGGTTLLAQVYRRGEQFRVQALNDGFTYTLQALASIFSGWILARAGWDGVVYSCIPLLALIIAVLLLERAVRTPQQTS